MTNGGQGGAIYDLGALSLTNVTFYDNVADGNGGAVYQGGGTLTVNDGMFTENQSSGINGGGALYIDVVTGSSGNASLTSVAFNYNTASQGGGAVYAVASATTATNSRCPPATSRATRRPNWAAAPSRPATS